MLVSRRTKNQMYIVYECHQLNAWPSCTYYCMSICNLLHVDFDSTQYSVTIPAGQKSGFYNISILKDGIAGESEESFLSIIKSTNPDGVTLTDMSFTRVNILNSDGKIIVKIVLVDNNFSIGFSCIVHWTKNYTCPTTRNLVFHVRSYTLIH